MSTVLGLVYTGRNVSWESSCKALNTTPGLIESYYTIALDRGRGGNTSDEVNFTITTIVTREVGTGVNASLI